MGVSADKTTETPFRFIELARIKSFADTQREAGCLSQSQVASLYLLYLFKWRLRYA